MLQDFLKTNREELIDRCRLKVAKRSAPRATAAEMENGIPLFLDQLTDMLPAELLDLDKGAAANDESTGPAESQLEASATSHGGELLRHDFTIEQVVHDYGDLCQAITELASEKEVRISVQEFGILNIKLDNAIGAAVTSYSAQRAKVNARQHALAWSQHLGELAHEMRNLLNTAILAVSAIRGGGLGFGGATAAALDRSHIGMRALIDRTLLAVRLENSPTAYSEVIEMAPFVSDVQVAAALEASQRQCELVVEPVEAGVFVEADRHIVASAVANLLQNACKFTRKHSRVVLRVGQSEERVSIEVQDECGGLEASVVESLFLPFSQHGEDRSGMGLGLAMSRRGVEASGGTLLARNVAGGCAFTIDLPRKRWPA